MAKNSHTTILRGFQHKVPMVRHQLVAQNTTWIKIKAFGKDSLERIKVRILLKDCVSIPSVQGVINTIRFISTSRSRHKSILPQPKPTINDS